MLALKEELTFDEKREKYWNLYLACTQEKENLFKDARDFGELMQLAQKQSDMLKAIEEKYELLMEDALEEWLQK